MLANVRPLGGWRGRRRPARKRLRRIITDKKTDLPGKSVYETKFDPPNADSARSLLDVQIHYPAEVVPVDGEGDRQREESRSA
jgi:hypothetical protein